MKRTLMEWMPILLIVAALAVGVNSQTTEITYQGQLQSSSAPANGSFDFEFVLFDAGGSQIGPALSRNGVSVTGGIFSVNLDFGSSFPGATRLLEIRVRPAGGGAFTTLSPRQPVTSTPYSIKSLTADNAANAANAANATNAVTATSFSGSLAGDVVGTQSATTVARLQSRNVASTPPLDGQVLKYNSSTSQWVPGTDNAGTGGGGGTITGVTPGTGLSGGGSTGNVTLSIGNGGVGSAQLADGSVTSAKIPSGQVVKTVNGLSDGVTLAAGSNISITPAGNTLTIASTGGGGCPSPCTAAIFNATQQYNIAGARILTIAGQDNLFAGERAGQSNTTGIGNTFVGREAGFSNTSGQYNSFFGFGAGLLQSTGNQNAFFGNGAGLNNGGNNNSFFGGSTGAGNTTGTENSYFGAGAGRENSAGNRNSFFGYSAGTSGSVTNFRDNAFFGHNAGRLNSGFQNSFFGSGAGAANSAAVNNTFIGNGSGESNDVGNNNSFMGWRSGALSRGFSNVFVGSQAGVLNGDGNRNTFIGTSAAFESSNGEFNTALGAFTVIDNNLKYATAIGYGARATQSNSLILGTGDVFTPPILIGIGTTAPLARLDIAATGNGVELLRFSTERPWVFRQIRSGSVSGLQLFSTSGQKYFEITSSDGTNVASFLADSTSSKVGIGTTNPVATLDVAGSLKLDILGGGGTVPLCRAFNNFIASCNSSSARYKTNVASFPSGLSAVDRLRPVSFNWKEGGASDVGFIAEEVAATEPQLAIYNEKGEVEGVKYDRLSVLFVNAFKEQQRQIEAQQARLDALTIAKTEQGVHLVNSDPLIHAMLNAIKEQKMQIETLRKVNSVQQNQISQLKRIVCSGTKRPAACMARH